MPRLLTIAMATTLLTAAPAFAQSSNGDSGSGDMGDPMAVSMSGPDGGDLGIVNVQPTPNGLLFEAEIDGVEPGVHGFHIHETGQCEGDFSSAGGHYNPTDAEHGFMAEGGPHAGDMENFTAADDGTATFAAFNPRVTMTGGDAPLDDSDGSALIIHSGADDYSSQPSGDAGSRVACGVIFPAS